MLKGTDVASYQGSTYVTAGLDFFFIKATEGMTYKNPKMNAQAYTARHAKKVTGFYHFLRPGRLGDQIEYFVEECASVPGDPLVLDWEDPGVTCVEKDAALRTLKRLRPKHQVLLYCNRDFWLHRDNTSYCADGLWIADYNAPAGHPRIQHRWMFHQYSDRNGVDSDVANFRNATDLRKWTHEFL